jgi:hypothetical protein
MAFPEGWNHEWPGVGSTSNTDYYAAHDRILIALPHLGAVDKLATATENIEYQAQHFSKRSLRGVVVVLGDRLVDQTREARQVYSTKPTSDWAIGFCLVSSSLLSRAMFSFFMGLSRTRSNLPILMFPTLESALNWAYEEAT